MRINVNVKERMSELTPGHFDEILRDILSEISVAQIITIPEVYAILSEEFSTSVLDELERRTKTE